MFNNILFPPNRAVYRIIWKNTMESERPWMKKRFTRIACWITKTTETDSEYAIILLFPLQNGCTNAPHRLLLTLFLPSTVLRFLNSKDKASIQIK
jgi:hypothetical protein